MKKTILALALALAALAAGAQEKVTVANYAQAERFSTKKVGQMVYSTSVRPHWFKGDDRFWYSYKTSAGTRYWLVDPAKGTKKELFDLPRLAMQISEIVRDPFDAQHLPMQDLKLREDKYFTFDIRSTAKEQDPDDSTRTRPKVFHFKYDIASGKLEQEPERKQLYPDWANVSPDGTIGVYAKGSNLWWMDSTSMRKAVKDPKDSTIVEHRITSDGVRQNGYGYENYKGDTTDDPEERHLPFDLVWSPDGRHFATFKWDMTPLKDLWVIHSVAMPRPELETYKYQMPGEEGPKGKLLVFSRRDTSWTSKDVKVYAFKSQDMSFYDDEPTAEDPYQEYVSRRWMGDNSGFYMQRLSRDLKRLDVCRVDVGADSTKTIISERSNTYVEYRNLRETPRGLVFWSERNGWANLYLFSKDGKTVKNITEGPFHVEDVLALGQDYLLVSACGINADENPYQMHTCRVPLSGGRPRQLDMADMDVAADASVDARWFVANCSRVDAKPVSVLYSAEGRKVMDLEESDFSELFAAGYRFPERFKVKAADGITDLYGAIYKPFDFDSTKVYPVCDYVYPGPQVEAVNISWSRGFTRTDRLAQLGFVVVTVGNRGGHPNRSKWYHNFGYGNLRDYGLEDQKYALQQLCSKYKWMDIDRIGIHGHSGGGFMSTAALLTYPDFFKVAVSCSGNHDNSIYNRWWSEQHHGIEEKVVKGDTTFVYSIETNQQLASRLKGHLMLVTGDIDDNVHPAGTIRVANALIKAHKRFEFVLMPEQRHGYGSIDDFFFWKMADFYTRWLMGDTTPRPVDIPGMNND
jgi:dipeptidyl aminopeptidase/acylaminoacyl peptidase